MDDIQESGIKCVTVGDGEVGKTAMLISFIENRFPTEYIPTVFENRSHKATFGGREYTLNLWDTAGQEEYKKLRVLSYPSTKVFLVCFSVVAVSSFINIREMWIPEIKHYKPNTPCILVGLKTDLRNDRETINKLFDLKQTPVTKEEGIQLAKHFKMSKYMECSAKTREGLEDIFLNVINIALQPHKKRVIKCVLL